MEQLIRKLPVPLVIAIICCILFIPFNGQMHLFDWDEINFAESAREMIASGNYLHNQIAFEAFYEKPPLFTWMQVISMKMFGINEFAARFPNAIVAFLSLNLMFFAGKTWKDEKLGWLWVLVYIGSLLPQFYFRSGIIDPLFNLLIYTGLVLFFLPHIKATLKPMKFSMLGGLAIGLAMLAKGPVALLISGIVIFIYFLLYKRERSFFYQIFTFSLSAIIPFGLWVLIEWMVAGPEFIVEFIIYQIRLLTTEDAGHGGFFGYHVVVILLACFPASVYGIPYLFRRNRLRSNVNQTIVWNQILFFTVLILFSIVQSKIVHYSSLCYFPLCLMAAYYLSSEKRRWLKPIFLFIGSIIFLAFLALPIVANNLDLLEQIIKNDSYTIAVLQNEIHWPWYTFLPAIFILIAIISSLSNKYEVWKSLIIFTIAVNGAILSFTPRIEALSQRTMINQIKAAHEKDAFADVLHQKSYADLFYGMYEKGDEKNPEYIITRNDRPLDQSESKNYEEIIKEFGIIVYQRNR